MTDVLRPERGGVRARLSQWALEAAPAALGVLRAVWPIPHAGATYVVTRHDDVREVLLADDDFPVAYHRKLDVLTGGEPFLLAMGDGEPYRRQLDAMRLAFRREDADARLGPAAEARAAAIVAAAPGRLEVVDALARTVTFEVLGDYLGVTAPPGGDLRVWATRLFEFQFADGGDDPALRREVDAIAPALRAHLDRLVAARRASGERTDDVLGRLVARQVADGRPDVTDAFIRTVLLGLIVGGLPQPPMAAPHALEQLLRRPAALASAQGAARAGDDALLRAHVLEALRFDPLAPALDRVAARDHVVAAGTPRATRIPAGAKVMAALGSAMMDGRRLRDPRRFSADRREHEYLHFGHGLHACFGTRVNLALLPAMLKPLLRRGIRRAAGSDGRLSKRGAFADRLWVELDAP